MNSRTKSGRVRSVRGVIALFFALLLTLGACESGSADSPFVGSWTLEIEEDLGFDISGKIEIESDGTGSAEVTFDGVSETAEFDWTADGNDITMEYPDGGIDTGTISDDGKTLTMVGDLVFTKD
ncbi:MAG: hypothetical protein GX483_03790 [Actinomycetaceae bacterium]|nr:hypothetical protein [Actinomycetaceae bacterium]